MDNLKVARQNRSRMARCRAGAGEEVMRASRGVSKEALAAEALQVVALEPSPEGLREGAAPSLGLLAVEPLAALNRVQGLGAEEEPAPAVVELAVAYQLALRAREAHSLAAVVQEEEAVPLVVDSPLETTQEEALPLVVDNPLEAAQQEEAVLLQVDSPLEAAREEALLNRLAMVSFRAAEEAAEEVELPTKLARVKFRVPLDSKGFGEVMSVLQRTDDGLKV